MTLPCLARGLARMREQSNLRQPETNITRHFNNSNILPVKKKYFNLQLRSCVCITCRGRGSESACTAGPENKTWSRGRDYCNDKFRCKFEFDDICIIYSESHGGSHERRLLNDLMNSYQKLGRLQNINISQTTLHRPKASRSPRYLLILMYLWKICWPGEIFLISMEYFATWSSQRGRCWTSRKPLL